MIVKCIYCTFLVVLNSWLCNKITKTKVYLLWYSKSADNFDLWMATIQMKTPKLWHQKELQPKSQKLRNRKQKSKQIIFNAWVIAIEQTDCFLLWLWSMLKISRMINYCEFNHFSPCIYWFPGTFVVMPSALHTPLFVFMLFAWSNISSITLNLICLFKPELLKAGFYFF